MTISSGGNVAYHRERGRGFGGEFRGRGLHGVNRGRVSFRGGNGGRGSFHGGNGGRGSFHGGNRGRGSFHGGNRGRGSFHGGNRGRGSFDGGNRGRGSFHGGNRLRDSFHFGNRGRGSFHGGNRGRGSFHSGDRGQGFHHSENIANSSGQSEIENLRENLFYFDTSGTLGICSDSGAEKQEEKSGEENAGKNAEEKAVKNVEEKAVKSWKEIARMKAEEKARIKAEEKERRNVEEKAFIMQKDESRFQYLLPQLLEDKNYMKMKHLFEDLKNDSFTNKIEHLKGMTLPEAIKFTVDARTELFTSKFKYQYPEGANTFNTIRNAVKNLSAPTLKESINLTKFKIIHSIPNSCLNEIENSDFPREVPNLPVVLKWEIEKLTEAAPNSFCGDLLQLLSDAGRCIVDFKQMEYIVNVHQKAADYLIKHPEVCPKINFEFK